MTRAPVRAPTPTAPDKDGGPPVHGTHSGKRLSTCGCPSSHCCLSCPLEVCIYDVPLRVQKMAHRAKVVREMKELGMKGPEIAQRLGLSERSLYKRPNVGGKAPTK